MKVALMLTRTCNLRCSYCYFKDSGYQSLKMNFKTIKSIIDKISKYCDKNKKILYIQFFGGEPLLEYNLIEKAIEYSKKKIKNSEIKYILNTNGTLLDKKRCEFLIKNNFEVRISFDGCIRVHDQQRIRQDGSGSSKEIIKNFKYFKNYNNWFVNMTISQKNVNDVFRGVLELWGKGAKKIKIQYNMDEIWSKKNIDGLKKELILVYRNYFYLKKRGKSIHLNPPINLNKSETCIENMYHNLFFDYDGRCMLCGCGDIGNKKNMWEVGNIKDSNFIRKLNFLEFDKDNIDIFKKRAINNENVLKLLNLPGIMFCDVCNFKKKGITLKTHIKNRFELNKAFEIAFKNSIPHKKEKFY